MEGVEMKNKLILSLRKRTEEAKEKSFYYRRNGPKDELTYWKGVWFGLRSFLQEVENTIVKDEASTSSGPTKKVFI
jgi:hypothetical protein